MRKPLDKRKKILIIGGSILGVLVLAIVGLAIFVFSNLSAFKDVEVAATGQLTQDPQDTDADPNLPDIADQDLTNIKAPETQATLPQDVYHILLYGVDTRSKEEFTGTRSDVMLLVVMDLKNKSIKLVSFMRDMLVPIPDHGYNRLNTAYAFGGPKLATEVISKQFGIQVNNYAVVNFWSTAAIIDLVNGVDVKLESDEIAQINKNIKEMNKLDSSAKVPTVSKAGEQHLTGAQAVAYMRIRHVGTDFQRTQRQRTVLTNLTKSLSNMTLDQMLQLLQVMPQYMRTNLSEGDMVNFAKAAFELRNAPVTQFRVPADDTYSGVNYNGASVLKVDFEKNAQMLGEFLQLGK